MHKLVFCVFLFLGVTAIFSQEPEQEEEEDEGEEDLGSEVDDGDDDGVRSARLAEPTWCDVCLQRQAQGYYLACPPECSK